MSLTPGARLGSYEIVALIGAGGMGEVYRARDTKLNRDVALKVLPEEFTHDPERLSRFKREAQVLASLNHPHIAAIYGLEESDGVHAIVMELVEGPTLAQRLKDVGNVPNVGRALSGPPKAPDPIGSGLPVNEALAIARQVADACQAAHEKGIVHRDLKPANIAFTADEQVKVLDFGLAKALEPTMPADVTNSPTMSLAATRAGVILGTAAYMSPEQAKGRPADKRSDVWAFGVVLYEMLAGKRAFEGEDLSDTLANVLKSDLNWSALPANLPSSVQTLLRGCLEKDRRSRISDISTALFVLKDPASLTPSGSVTTAATTSPTPERLTWLAAMVAVAALVGSSVFFLTRPSSEPATAIRFQVPPTSAGVAFTGTSYSTALSPDGRRIAFPVLGSDGRSMLAVRALDALEWQVLSGTEGAVGAANGYFWSPDSRFIGFFAQGKLRKIDVNGGPPQPLCDAPSGQGGTWNSDGIIVFAPNATSGLFRVSAAGGTPTQLTTLDATRQERSHRWPSFLPDGRHFLYVAQSPTRIHIGSIDSSDRIELVASDSKALYLDGHLLFVREGTLLAQPFDASSSSITGESFPIAEEVALNTVTAAAAMSASATGVLAYRTGAESEPSQLVWFDRAGRQLGTVGEPADQMNVEFSPDEKRVAVSVLDPARNTRDIAIYDLNRNGLKTRFTFDQADDFMAVWSPDGGRLAFSSSRKGQMDIYMKASNSVGTEELVLDDARSNIHPRTWSADNRFILYTTGTNGRPTGNDVWVLPLTGDRKPVPVVQTPFNETMGRLSPNGRWVAYRSDESGGGNEVFVVPLTTDAPAPSAIATPATSGKWQVSTTGGDYPRWRRDGRELFYLSNDDMLMAAEVNVQGAAFQVGEVRQLFKVRGRLANWLGFGVGYNYDVTADGQRFLVNTITEQAAPTPITVVVNWTATLRK